MKPVTYNNWETKTVLVNTPGVYDYEVGAASSLILIDLCLDGGDREITVRLSGDGASAEMFGLCLQDGSDVSKTQHKIIHNAPNTRSKLVMKAVLEGKSVLDYDAKVKIDKPACTGNQKADVLLLSKTARAKAVPRLDISNMNSTCSHGVTMSKISDAATFFMRSRGLDEEQAKNMAILAHIDPVLSKLPDDMRKEIRNIYE